MPPKASPGELQCLCYFVQAWGCQCCCAMVWTTAPPWSSAQRTRRSSPCCASPFSQLGRVEVEGAQCGVPAALHPFRPAQHHCGPHCHPVLPALSPTVDAHDLHCSAAAAARRGILPAMPRGRGTGTPQDQCTLGSGLSAESRAAWRGPAWRGPAWREPVAYGKAAKMYFSTYAWDFAWTCANGASQPWDQPLFTLFVPTC